MLSVIGEVVIAPIIFIDNLMKEEIRKLTIVNEDVLEDLDCMNSEADFIIIDQRFVGVVAIDEQQKPAVYRLVQERTVLDCMLGQDYVALVQAGKVVRLMELKDLVFGVAEADNLAV